jgi:hypothetical protein
VSSVKYELGFYIPEDDISQISFLVDSNGDEIGMHNYPYKMRTLTEIHSISDLDALSAVALKGRSSGT